MQYHEDTHAVAEEIKPFVSPMAIPYICARRKAAQTPKKKVYGEASVTLMQGIVGAGLAVLSVLGLFLLVTPH